jgi:phosphoribosylformylglycinamidine synthase
MSFDRAGLELYLLGETHEDFAGSEWAFIHDQRGGQVPQSDLQAAMRLNSLLVAGRTEKIFTAAHDLSQGGLSATLTEMVLRHGVGATVMLNNPAVDLLSETPGRVVVAIEASKKDALLAQAKKSNIACNQIGTTGGDSLRINNVVISLTELRQAHTETFPRLFG